MMAVLGLLLFRRRLPNVKKLTESSSAFLWKKGNSQAMDHYWVFLISTPSEQREVTRVSGNQGVAGS